MKRENIMRMILLLAGSLLLAGGATVVGVYSIDGAILPVFFGYLAFVAGYEISRHEPRSIDKLGRFKSLVIEKNLIQRVERYGLTLFGVLLISYGTTLFAQIILDLHSSSPAVAGAITFGGYMTAHLGVNEVLV